MTYSQIKELYEYYYDNRSCVEMAITSIGMSYVTFDEIISRDNIEYGGYVYSADEYVVDYYGNLLSMDNAFYCNGEEDWFSNDDAVTVYEYRNEHTYSSKWAESNPDLSEFRGDYYDRDALDYHDLVYVEDTDEIGHRDNVYYHDEEGNYYSYPPEEYTRGYHNGSYKSFQFDGKSKYRIGYEIEKEDIEVLRSIDIQGFESETDDYWRKERDGSLDSDSGYELISPTFEFNIDKIFEHIESSGVLVSHINAETSKSCGGHIHVSEKGVNGNDLFDKIKGYTPLLYALYYGRVDKTYCKGKANRDLVDDNQKYQAIKIHHDRVEFRIISAVPNVKTLKWRSKLLMMILQNPTHDIIKAYYNVDTKFTKLLKQTYSDDKLLDLKERFVKYTKEFENLDIK